MRAFVLMLCVACAADGDGDGEIYDTGLTDLGPADCEGFTGTHHDDLGSGSEADPFVLCNADQLASLRQDDPFVGRKTHYLLGADIDLAGVEFGSGISYCNQVSPEPVGGFKGTLDGGGHTVSNMTIDSQGTFAGFIGCLNGGTIRDIVFASPRVIWTGGDRLLDGYWYGVAAGYAYYATFEDIVVLDGVVTDPKQAELV